MDRRRLMTLLWLAFAAWVGMTLFDAPRNRGVERPRGTAETGSTIETGSTVAQAQPVQPDAVARQHPIEPAAMRTVVPPGDFSRNREMLEAMARGGNAEAALRLGEVLRACAPVTNRSRRAPLAITAQTPFDLDLRAIGVLPVDATLGPAELERVALCDGVRDYTDADRLAALDWLVLAADLGAPVAMAMRFDVELERIGGDRATRIDQAHRLVELRPRASAMLQRAADTGEPRALARLAAAHASGDIATRDPVLARAYELAAASMFMRAGSGRAAEMQRFGAALDPAQRRQAGDAAERILARCCTPEVE